MDLADGIDCRACRLSYWETGADPPCDETTENKETGEQVHRCKYGLVDLHPDNWATINAWRYVRVFGPEAGTRLLIAAVGDQHVSEIAEELVLLQSAQNGRDEQRRKARG